MYRVEQKTKKIFYKLPKPRLFSPKLAKMYCGHLLYLYPDDDVVSKTIWLTHYWEKEDTQILERELKGASSIKTCVDVGAFIGYYSILFSRYSTFVHSFEPNPIALSLLQSSFRINPSFGVLHANQVLLSHRNGDIEQLFINQNGNKGASSFIKKEGKFIFCKTRSIDSYDFQHVDFMKIDAESAEPLILLGAKKTIQERRINYILMEYTPTAWNSGQRSILNSLIFDYYKVELKGKKIAIDDLRKVSQIVNLHCKLRK